LYNVLDDGSGNANFTGTVTGSSFIKSGGTSAQVLMANGSTTNGFTGTVTTASLVGKTITITNGVITNVA